MTTRQTAWTRFVSADSALREQRYADYKKMPYEIRELVDEQIAKMNKTPPRGKKLEGETLQKWLWCAYDLMDRPARYRAFQDLRKSPDKREEFEQQNAKLMQALSKK